MLMIPTASATATLTIGAITYESTIVKDESMTITSSVTASTVSGTLTVDVTMTDNSGLFDIPTPTQQIQFTTDGTKAVSWTITATTSGNNPAPFTITASGDDGSIGAKTSSSVVTVKDRPVITVLASSNISSISAGNSAQISYTVSNAASSGAADSTNVVITLVRPSGWSLSSGTDSYTLGTIAPGGSLVGSWVVMANTPLASNTFTLNVASTIPGGTVSNTTSITGPSSTDNSNSNTGSGGGGGGGGGASNEKYSNIEVKEKYDLAIYKDKITSYKFSDKKNPVLYINITGNVNSGDITTSVEVLRNNSTMVKNAPEGLAYKNFNIWVGTSGFGMPGNKKIKEAIISFYISNSWFERNNINKEDVRLVLWDGSQWINLETEEKNKDSINTYYEAKTTSFSNFAIIGTTSIKKIKETLLTTSPEQSEDKSSAETSPTEKSPGFSLIVAATIFSVVYYLLKNRR